MRGDERVGEREQLIELIDALFPADSQDPETARIGRALLLEAQDQVQDWRDEPTEVLREYARLCEEYRERARRGANP
jgi:hypothetical protein